MPEGLEEDAHDFQAQIAKAALMIVRIEPDDIKDKRERDWAHEGIVAFSKICTHVGCPISLYEQQTHHVLCPCHQSTFDLSDGARVIFGPAGHALPQLRIGVNERGLPRGARRLRRARRSCLLGARMSTATDTRRARRPPASGSPTGRTAGSGIYGLAKANMRKIFPDHWSFMLGEICLYSFIIIILTGVYLTLFFHPSMNEVVYHGSYVPMQGIRMSEAYASTLDISFDVRGGLLIRQIHHWAALIFLAAMFVHMMRVFFTGAFRKPREINWLFGFLLFVLGMFTGFTGYSLPDDLLSGTGVRFMEGAILSMPIVGTYLSMFLFGGEFPGTDIVARFYSIHILLLPGIMLGLRGRPPDPGLLPQAHAVRGSRTTNKNVVGMPLLPVYMAKAGGFFFLVFGCHRGHRGASPRSTRSGRSAPTVPTRCPPAPSPTGTWASPRA